MHRHLHCHGNEAGADADGGFDTHVGHSHLPVVADWVGGD